MLLIEQSLTCSNISDILRDTVISDVTGCQWRRVCPPPSLLFARMNHGSPGEPAASSYFNHFSAASKRRMLWEGKYYTPRREQGWLKAIKTLHMFFAVQLKCYCKTKKKCPPEPILDFFLCPPWRLKITHSWRTVKRLRPFPDASI